jgi:chorismate synthase
MSAYQAHQLDALQNAIDIAQREIETLRGALHVLLDNVDYTVGNCLPYEPVDAVLPESILNVVKEALK